MVNATERTKLAVLKAVRERAEQTRPARITNGPKSLGLYLQKCLQSHEMSRVNFAQSLDMEIELVDGILDGILPESELHADLLAELAEAIDCPFETLQGVLKGTVEKPANGWAPLA